MIIELILTILSYLPIAFAIVFLGVFGWLFLDMLNEIDRKRYEWHETPQEELDAHYAAYVKELADTESSELISCGLTEHAIVVTVELFNHAKSSMDILTDQEGLRTIYNDPRVVEAMEKFMDRGGNVRMIIQDGKINETA